jgi:DNA-binding NtrC family response regulator
MKNYKVLIVEDEPSTLMLLSQMVNSMGDFDIISCHSAREALAALSDKSEKWQPDLVLSDFLMKNGDGMDLLGSLRRQYGLNLPFVFVTSAGRELGPLLSHQTNIEIIDKPLRVQRIKEVFSKHNMLPASFSQVPFKAA